MKEKLPLNQQDIKILWKHLLPTILFPFLAAGMFYAFFSYFGNDTDSSFLQDNISLYIVVGFSIFFFGIIAYMIGRYAIDLRRGFKYRIEGKITDKKLSVRTSTTHSSNGKTGGSSNSSSTTRYYNVFIDGVKYPIESQHYGKVKVGNKVIMEKAPKSHITLFLEVDNAYELSLEKTIAANDNRQKLLSSPPSIIPFTQEDINALKRGFMAKVKFRLIWFLPPMLIALTVIANGKQSFLVFLFPIVLVPAYQLWKFMREWKQYNSNKQYSCKEAMLTIVQDKSKYSYNGKGSNNIKTTHGYLKVNDQIYEKLNPGDKIILYKPAKGNQVLSVSTATNEEWYIM